MLERNLTEPPPVIAPEKPVVIPWILPEVKPGPEPMRPEPDIPEPAPITSPDEEPEICPCTCP